MTAPLLTALNRVTDWLWVGDASAGRDWAQLDRLGITAVFNATAESDGWPADVKARIPYLRLNQDDGQPIPFPKLDAFVVWLALIGATQRRPLLVHCGAGVSRAATFAAVALMIVQGSTWAGAVALIRTARPQVAPNPVLVASVASWWRAHGGVEWALVGTS